MTEKTIYIAFDGKEFEDYNECERYESKELQDKYGKDLLTYNDYGTLLPLDNDYRLSQDSAYVVCKSKEALNYLNKIFNDNRTNNIDYNGNFPASFYYNFETDEWEEIESHIKELQEEIDMLSKYIVKE
jgi:hypothetical protein|nr:MAG TPA: hypothetical protein [Caudoviricetes sp.]